MAVNPTVLYNALSKISPISASNYLKRPHTGYSITDHVRFMVYSMLSSGRKWSQIQSHSVQIDRIFNNFNPNWIKQQNPADLQAKLQSINCGNRTIKKQMCGLKDNIITLEGIARNNNGLVENYYDMMINNDQLSVLVRELAYGKYKLKGMGVALVCEYLKNMYDSILKPDIHTRRFIGSDRMGYLNKKIPSESETIQIYSSHSNATGISARDIDTMVWNFCVNNCGEKPACDSGFSCPLKQFCNH